MPNGGEKRVVEAKNECARALKHLQKIAEKYHNQAAVELLLETEQRLAGEKFTLVVLGEFKRGKSTLINALLGREIVPTAVVPLTALPTIIQYDDNLNAEVIYLNGRRENIKLEQIPAFVTEKENPRNMKQVKEVVIGLTSPLLEEGVVLVDTPGIGSVHQHNTEAAYAYLPRADAAVFIFTADSPMSQAELNYLLQVRTAVKKFFFVLNKVDLLTEEEKREVEEFARQVLWERLGEEPQIWALSARLGLKAALGASKELWQESGMADFVRELLNFVHSQKSIFVIRSAAERALRILNDLQLFLELRQKAAEENLEDLKAKIAFFNRQKEILEQEREDCIYLLYREVERLGRMVGEDIEAYQEEIRPQLLVQLEEYFHALSRQSLSNRELMAQVNEFIENVIREKLTAWRLAEGEKICALLQQGIQRFYNRMEEIVDGLLQVAADIFSLPREQIKVTKEYVMGEQEFYFYFFADPTFIPSFESLAVSGLFPRRLLGGLLLGSLKRKMVELWERNCGRARHGFVYGLMEEVRKSVGRLRLRSDAVLYGLQQALNQAVEQKKLAAESHQLLSRQWKEEEEELRALRLALLSLLEG